MLVVKKKGLIKKIGSKIIKNKRRVTVKRRQTAFELVRGRYCVFTDGAGKHVGMTINRLDNFVNQSFFFFLVGFATFQATKHATLQLRSLHSYVRNAT